jgi:hypothetical protein
MIFNLQQAGGLNPDRTTGTTSAAQAYIATESPPTTRTQNLGMAQAVSRIMEGFGPVSFKPSLSKRYDYSCDGLIAPSYHNHVVCLAFL